MGSKKNPLYNKPCSGHERCTVPPLLNHSMGNLAMIAISVYDKTNTNSPTRLGQ